MTKPLFSETGCGGRISWEERPSTLSGPPPVPSVPCLAGMPQGPLWARYAGLGPCTSFALQAGSGQAFPLLSTARPRLGWEACPACPPVQVELAEVTAGPSLAGAWLAPHAEGVPSRTGCPSGFGRGRSCLSHCPKHHTPASVPSLHSLPGPVLPRLMGSGNVQFVQGHLPPNFTSWHQQAG